MTLQQLEYILAVNQHRHFGRAAEYCGVTQPTLSAMIQKLEEELGVKLFDRSAQPICPTHIGERILKQARTIILQAEQIQNLVNEEQESISGTLRLGILPTIAPYLLPRFYPQFLEQHPQLDVRVSEMKTKEIEQTLEDGELDAAIIATLPSAVHLTGETLFFEEFYAYVSTTSKLFDEKVVRTSDLQNEKLWLLDEGHCFRDQLLKFCHLQQALSSREAYRLGSMETFMRMVESGQGVTFIPQMALAQLNTCQQELVRPFAIPRPTRQIILVTKKDFVRHKLLELLKEAIVKTIDKKMLSLQQSQYLV